MSGKRAKQARKEAKENESPEERLERLAKETKFNLIKPFGPFVGMFTMPLEITQALIEKTDEILKNGQIVTGKHTYKRTKRFY